jgi:GNAT superfamily N-acetyltransferase
MDIRVLEPKDIADVKKIFYESSTVKEFKDLEAKNSFEWKYFGWYLQNYPELFFVACETEAGNQKPTILGYIASCPETLKAKDLMHANPSLEIFIDLYADFPAHLHMNLTEKARGKGIGTLLIQSLESRLRLKGLHGVHLITSPSARNRNFYAKNLFTITHERKFKDVPLLFMAKKI